MTEYKPVPNISGYLVGNDGTVWSSYAAAGSLLVDGVPYKKLKGCIRSDGYRTVTLSREKRVYQFLIHKLVLLVFRGECPTGMQGCHNNGDQSDNSLTNLRYDTPKNNMGDKIIHGTILRGTDIKQSKLTELDVVRIRFLADYGVPGSVLS